MSVTERPAALAGSSANNGLDLALRALHPVCEIAPRKVIETGTNGIYDPREIARLVERLIGSDFSSR